MAGLILVDANLLIYATIQGSPQHEKSMLWLCEVLNGSARVGLPWASLLAYCRIVSNPRIFSKPVALSDAWLQVGGWLDLPCVWTPNPTEAHFDVLDRMMLAVASSNHIPDAELAALAVEHGLELVSADRGFARFPGLRFRNPLE